MTRNLKKVFTAVASATVVIVLGVGLNVSTITGAFACSYDLQGVGYPPECEYRPPGGSSNQGSGPPPSVYQQSPTDLKQRQMNALNDQGLSLSRHGKYIEAIRMFEAALRMSESASHSAIILQNIANDYGKLGLAAFGNKEFATAIRFFEDELNTGAPGTDRRRVQNNIGNSYAHLAGIAYGAEKLSEAKRLYDLAAQYAPDNPTYAASVAAIQRREQEQRNINAWSAQLSRKAEEDRRRGEAASQSVANLLDAVNTTTTAPAGIVGVMGATPANPTLEFLGGDRTASGAPKLATAAQELKAAADRDNIKRGCNIFDSGSNCSDAGTLPSIREDSRLAWARSLAQSPVQFEKFKKWSEIPQNQQLIVDMNNTWNDLTKAQENEASVKKAREEMAPGPARGRIDLQYTNATEEKRKKDLAFTKAQRLAREAIQKGGINLVSE